MGMIDTGMGLKTGQYELPVEQEIADVGGAEDFVQVSEFRWSTLATLNGLQQTWRSERVAGVDGGGRAASCWPGTVTE